PPTRHRRQEQGLERCALALAADRVGSREQRQERADGDGDLDDEVDRLALLEEVERAIRRDEVRHRAHDDAEREAQQQAAPADPEVPELLLEHDGHQAASVIARNASLRRAPSSSKESSATPESSRARTASLTTASWPLSPEPTNPTVSQPGRPSGRTT